MAGYGEWVSHGGTATIVLVAALAGAAAGVAYPAARLPFPERPPETGRAASVLMLAAWMLAVVALLTSVAAYEMQVDRAGLQRTAPASPVTPVTPVTLMGLAVLFVVIAVAQKARGWRATASSAVIGAAAAPMIFEVPFDFIIPRSHPVLDPGLYRLLLFGTLILIGIATLALLGLSPAVRLQRGALWCLAAMLALFAGWSLFGFSYSSFPGPAVVDAPARILALVTTLTLFLPERVRAQTRQPAYAAAASETGTAVPRKSH